jgi:hypothetical protein
MAGLGGEVPDFDGLLDSDQHKDTEVIVREEEIPTAGDQEHAGDKRSRQGTPDNHITLEAHWVVLRSLSPYFRAKVRHCQIRDGFEVAVLPTSAMTAHQNGRRQA